MSTDILELTSWEDVRFVLRSRSFNQVGPEDNYAEGTRLQAQIIGESLTMVRGEGHVERRRIESVLFRLPTLVMYERDRVRPRLARILERQAAQKGADGVVRGDLVELSQEMLLDVMGTLVGIDLDVPGTEERFRDLFLALDNGGRIRHMVDMDAVLAEALPAQRAFEEELLRPAWRRREHLLAEVAAGRLSEDELPNDLIMLMLRNRDHFAQWDEGIYTREAHLFVIASIGTTTREIALAVDEIEQWIDAHPEDAGRRLDPEFLARAFAESCRFHQSIQDVGRTAVEDVTVPSGATIRKGQPVRLSLVGANRDIVGDGADRFDPYRPDPSQGAPYGLAFSDGQHTCIGKILVLGGTGGNDRRLGTALTALLAFYEAGMRRDPLREPVLKDTTTKRFHEYPVVFERL